MGGWCLEGKRVEIYLVHIINQRKHRPRIAIYHECTVEVVRSLRCLGYCDGAVWLADYRWRLEVAEVLAFVEGGVVRILAAVLGRICECERSRESKVEEGKETHFWCRCLPQKQEIKY